MDKTTINLIKDMALKAQALADAMKKLADHAEKEQTMTVADLAQNMKRLDLN